MSRFIFRGLILTAGVVFAVGIIVAAPRFESLRLQSIAGEDVAPEEPQPTRAELVTKALAAAYPGRIERAEFRDDDWAVLMDGIWYYYAGGRLLPEELLEKAEEYSSSFGIPNYQSELPLWREPSSEQAGRFRERDSSRNNNNNDRPRAPRQRSYHFREDLWQAHSRDESHQRMKTVDFLNFSLVIHSGIAEILPYVEERILSAAKTNRQVQSWVNNIGTASAWSWRNIAGSQSRSYHAYGIAIDILPKSLDGKETYWQWARERRSDWWNIPYEDRYHPPDEVVKAFEAYGFIWGGKWPYFDTMHFEYRPEVFILSGLELETPPYPL